jgi:hypothetical protein
MTFEQGGIEHQIRREVRRRKRMEKLVLRKFFVDYCKSALGGRASSAWFLVEDCGRRFK